MKIKLINLNLYEGGLLFNNILEFLKLEKPDILTLQEVYNGKDKKLAQNLRSLDILKKTLPDFEYYYSPELKDNRQEGNIDLGNAIFTRFSITSQKTIFINSSYDEKWIKSEKKMIFQTVLKTYNTLR